jgi:hypothetical protein
MELKTNACRILAGNPEGKKPPRIFRRKIENNIKTDLTDIGWDGINWGDFPRDKDQWTW